MTFCTKSDWVSFFISTAKTASKNIGALVCFMKFLCPEVFLYLYKYTLQHCMKYYCHVWAGTPSIYLKMLDKLKWVYRTSGPSVAVSLEPLACC